MYIHSCFTVHTYIHIFICRFVEVAATIFNGGNLSVAMLSNEQVSA